MTDKALLVGINAYPQCPLNGCINDITDMADYLMNHCGFDRKDIRLLIDDRATTQGILERLQWLADGAKSGDRLFFQFSGHGIQIATRNPEGELDGLDEAICITGDTKIPLLDGTEKTIEELSKYDCPFWVYSSDKDGNIKPGLALKAWRTAINKDILKITLDNGESVKCTKNHLWMMRDGTYRKAIELNIGDSLMPLYRNERKHKNGHLSYEGIWNHTSQKYEDTHRIVAGNCPSDILLKAKEQNCGVVVHHKNFNSRDNHPENLQWMTWVEHSNLHMCDEDKKKEISIRSKDMWNQPGFKEKLSLVQSNAAKLRWQSAEYRELIRNASKKQDLTPMRIGAKKYNDALTEEQKFIRCSNAGKKNKGKKKPEGFNEHLKQRWEDQEYREKMTNTQSIAMQKRWNDPELKEKMLNEQKIARDKKKNNNHKVVSIEEFGVADVYDITVQEYENFAVSAGVILHNCPIDFDWSDAKMIRDKKFHEIFAGIPEGVEFIWVSDSCHSQDLTKDMRRWAIRALPTPADVRFAIETTKQLGIMPKGMSSPINVAMISGCKSNQTSADAFFNGRYNGACTYFLLQELKKNPTAPLTDIVQNLDKVIAEAHYEQIPCLEGSSILTSKSFFVK